MTAPRIEYGARIVCPSAVVYVKSFDRTVVDAWMLAYGAITPLLLVTRIWDGDAHAGWELGA